MPADHCRVGADAGAAPDDGRKEFRLAVHVRARQQDVGEYHAGSAEHVFFQYHAVINRDVVLYLAAVTDPDARTDHHVLADYAASPYPAAGQNVCEVPDFRPCSNLHVRVDDRRGMNENTFAHVSSLAPRHAAWAREIASPITEAAAALLRPSNFS